MGFSLLRQTRIYFSIWSNKEKAILSYSCGMLSIEHEQNQFPAFNKLWMGQPMTQQEEIILSEAYWLGYWNLAWASDSYGFNPGSFCPCMTLTGLTQS